MTRQTATEINSAKWHTQATNSYFFSCGPNSLTRALAASLLTFQDHTRTLIHSIGLFWTSDRPFAGTSTWQHTHIFKRQTSMLLAGFESAIPASKRPQTYPLNILIASQHIFHWNTLVTACKRVTIWLIPSPPLLRLQSFSWFGKSTYTNSTFIVFTVVSSYGRACYMQQRNKMWAL